MTSPFAIVTLALGPDTLGPGTLAICPLPGGTGNLEGDLVQLRSFAPALVISMTESTEMARLGAAALPQALRQAGIGWLHFPVQDYAIPTPQTDALWPAIANRAQQELARGGRVVVHCRGGLGRSGMVALRLMIAAGEAPEAALRRLRAARPGAIETEQQLHWAMQDRQ